MIAVAVGASPYLEPQCRSLSETGAGSVDGKHSSMSHGHFRHPFDEHPRELVRSKDHQDPALGI